MECRDGLVGSVFIPLNGKRFLFFFLEHDIETQTVVVKGRTQFQVHG